jgi:prevent-host-death family protein
MNMTTIRPSVDLRNNYNEISKFCNEYREPVFITKNGKGDLAVMSMELFNRLNGKQELYRLIDEGLEDVKNGDTMPFEDAMVELRERIAKR